MLLQALKEVGASAGEAEEQPATYVDEQSQLKQDFLRVSCAALFLLR